MHAIILFSHGSVLCGAEQNLLAIARRLSSPERPVAAGFLNYSQPRFAEAVERCAVAGVTDITVVPYFLVAGKFVRDELRAHIDSARERYPQLRFVVGDALRFHPAIADAIVACADRARPPAEWGADLREQAAAYCRESDACPLYATQDCRVRSSVGAPA